MRRGYSSCGSWATGVHVVDAGARHLEGNERAGARGGRRKIVRAVRERILQIAYSCHDGHDGVETVKGVVTLAELACERDDGYPGVAGTPSHSPRRFSCGSLAINRSFTGQDKISGADVAVKVPRVEDDVDAWFEFTVKWTKDSCSEAARRSGSRTVDECAIKCVFQEASNSPEMLVEFLDDFRSGTFLWAEDRARPVFPCPSFHEILYHPMN